MTLIKKIIYYFLIPVVTVLTAFSLILHYRRLAFMEKMGLFAALPASDLASFEKELLLSNLFFILSAAILISTFIAFLTKKYVRPIVKLRNIA